MDETFAESILDRAAPHRVLGRRLRPYSFWHAAQLDFLRNPFGLGERPFLFASFFSVDLLAQLETAARVCRLRYPATLRRRSSLSAFITRARRVITLRRCVRQRGYYAAQVAAFAAYLEDYDNGPVYGQTEHSVAAKTPWYMLAVRQLRINRPELTEAQAWNTPIGLGGWINAAAAEARGNPIEILTADDRAAFRAAGVAI